ncbi:hypothetical protein WA577_005975, partial [Blastocystis sp. JDR]
MLEQRFLITIANEDNSISFNVTVRSKQFIRSLSILVASHLNKSYNCNNPPFFLVFNGKKLEDDDTIESLGIMEASVVYVVPLDKTVGEEEENAIISRLSTQDEEDEEMISIYSLIDEGKIVEAFTKLRSSLFYMKNIPKVVHKLRLRFSNIPYHPNIFVGVHELFYIAVKCNVNY